MLIQNELSGDSGDEIALFYLERSQEEGVALLPPVSAQINWEPAHLKLLFHTEENEFLWKISEPEIENFPSFVACMILQYQEAEKNSSADHPKEMLNSIG